jgi:nucleotide-binding universal stress UspA family protein
MPTITSRNDSAVRILCATDFSTRALAATTRAGRLAQVPGGELELMHVIPLRNAPVYRICGWEANRREVAAEAMARLRAMAAEAQARFDVPVTVHVALGVAHAQIAARAESTRADLVVVGPHGDRAVRDVFVGSTAQHLRRPLQVPLLIARKRSTRKYERVLVAVDFSPASASAAHAAATLFPEAALHFLHVCNPLFEARLAMADAGGDAVRLYRNQALLNAGRELDSFIRGNGLQRRRASSLVRHGHAPACIREAASELAASVVAFGAKGKSRLESTILGSVSADFLSGTQHDALLVKATRSRRESDEGVRRDMHAETAAI